MAAATEKNSPRKRFRQIGLSTLLLSTACLAVWYNDWINRYRIVKLKDELAASRPLARELSLRDHEHLVIIKQEEHTMDDHRWHVYLPHDDYQLHVITTQIPKHVLSNAKPQRSSAKTDTGSSPPAEGSAPLRRGRHTIELDTYDLPGETIVEVKVDLESVVLLKRPRGWDPGVGSSGGGNFDTQAVLPADESAVLFERIFTVRDTTTSNWSQPHPDGNGIKLWIAPNASNASSRN